MYGRRERCLSFFFLILLIHIHNLQVNFVFSDIDESVTNLSGFNTELVVEATVRCLETIRPGLGLSTVLPVNMAARFRLGATLAQTCTVNIFSEGTDLKRLFLILLILIKLSGTWIQR